MSLLTTLTKKVASPVSSLAKGISSKVVPSIIKGANKVTDFAGARGVADQFGATIAKATAPKSVSKYVQSPKASDVYKSAAMSSLNFAPVGKILQGAKLGAGALKSGFKSASANLAEKMAGASRKAVVPKVSPTTKLEVKTTSARTTPKIDTRTTPTKVGTVKTTAPKRSPVVKTGLGLGAVGLGAAGIGALTPDGTSTTPQVDAFVPPNYNGSNFVQDTQNAQGATSVNPYPPDVSFGNNEGGAFESPTPAPQTGTQMGGSFQPGFASSAFSGGGIGTGVGGSGGSQYKAPTDEYIEEEDEKDRRTYRTDEEDAQREAFKRTQRQIERDETTRGQQDRQIESYNKRIADLTNRQAGYGIDLEGSAASSSAREGLATMFDRETRKSLIPLQTSLALVQAERDRMDRLKQQQFENDQLTAPKPQEGFTVGKDQQRWEIDPVTGQYKLVASGYQTPEEQEDPYKTLSEGQTLLRINPQTGQYEQVYSAPKTYKQGTVGGAGSGYGTANVSSAAQGIIDQINLGANLDDLIKGTSNAAQNLRNEVIRGLNAQGGMSTKATEILQQGKEVVDKMLNDKSYNSLGGYSSRLGGQFTTGYGDAKAMAQQLESILARDNLGLLKGAMSDNDLKFIKSMSSGFDGEGIQSDAFVKQKLESIQSKLAQKLRSQSGGQQPQVKNVGGYNYVQGQDGNWYLQ